jgi:hypothetical protein
MSCPKEIRCDYNMERTHDSLCNLFCTADKAVGCNYKNTEFARQNCKEFKEIIVVSPDIVVLDISVEDHAEIVECLREDQIEYATRTYGENSSYEIYRRGTKTIVDLVRHLIIRKENLEKNYPIGHDQRDGAQTRISEIDQTLLAIKAMSELRGS